MPTSTRPGQKTAMISSTSLDLPEHRKQVVEACLRESVFPIGMEQLPVRDANAVTVDREMVDKADIYIGIFGVRYGEVPPGYDISYTELEFNRAVERGIPILVFVMHKDHLLTAEMFEADATAQQKLTDLKKRASAGRIRGEFKSPEELRGLVIQALADLRRREEDEKGKPAPSFHRHYDIPEAPEPFIAHPYTLLQTHRLVGRQAELNLLTDWVAKPESDVYKARILNIVAIGGMGKSALTWQWFNQIAPQEMKPLAGRMWWSFYESDASFENFVTRALAYVTRRPLAEVEQIPVSDRERQLLEALNSEPFLIVLDGMERLLIAYARMDAAYLDGMGTQALGTHAPSRALSAETTSSDTYALPATSAREGAGVPRKTADPRVGNFLRKLAGVKASRILVSTRLHPADLENKVNGNPLPGCFRRDLVGLADDDALELWRKFNVTGARDQLLSIFNRVENHPLLIQALAGEVARFRRAPGDFEAWQKAHPDFNPFQDLPLMQMKSHVLEFAMRGLSDQARQVLWTIAAFRMPASYDMLVAVLTGEAKPCADERELDVVLNELEDRGLIGWDKRANRYDLHPIVRGVVWSGLGDDARHGVYINLHAHFDAMPRINNSGQLTLPGFLLSGGRYSLIFSNLVDPTPAIELYNTLIGLGSYDDAQKLFEERLEEAMLLHPSVSRQWVELLEMLFLDGLDQLPRLSYLGDQAYTLSALAQGYQTTGQPERAASFYYRHNAICSGMMQRRRLINGLCYLSNALFLSGALFESEVAAHRALVITSEDDDYEDDDYEDDDYEDDDYEDDDYEDDDYEDDDYEDDYKKDIRFREEISLNWATLALAARKIGYKSQIPLLMDEVDDDEVDEFDIEPIGGDDFFLAQRALWFDEFVAAREFANSAWELASVRNYERDFIRAARMQGAAALGLGDFATADERLHHALTRARQVNFVEEELAALISLAELGRRQIQPAEPRELLDDVWEAAERGPYPLFHADGLNVLAQIERDAGNTAKAIEAATQAYRLAWCDGPPYAYHWGLEAARKHLRELGAPEPEMPPFDPSKYEPMPEVEINPKDEFYVEIGEDE